MRAKYQIDTTNTMIGKTEDEETQTICGKPKKSQRAPKNDEK